MDAPVGGDDLAQAVHVGGFQLGELAVVQNGLDDGVLAPQLLQHLGVGGVARLGLFHRRQPQLFKEDLAQLLGGVDVELLPRQRENGLLVPGDALGQGLAEGGEGFPVHQHPGQLHLGQHGAQGQLHLLVELGEVQFLQTLGQGLIKCVDEGAVAQKGAHGPADLGGGAVPVLRIGIGVLSGGAGLLKGKEGVEGAGGQILLGLGKFLVVVGEPQLFQVVAAVGGSQQVGGHLGVKADVPGFHALVQQLADQLLGAVDHLGDAGTKEGFQHLGIVFQAAGKEQGSVGLRGAGIEADTNGVQVGQGQHGHVVSLPPQGQQFFRPGEAVHHLAGAGALHQLVLLGRALPLGGGEVVFVDEFGEFQLQKQLVEPVVVHIPAHIGLRVKFQGGVAADGGQVVGHAGHLLPLLELFDDTGLGGGAGGHLRGGHGGVEVINGAVAPHQGHGRLFSHSLDAWDVVAGVSHEGLQVDDVDGVKAVLLPEHLGGHVPGGGAAHAGGHQLDGGGVGDQLEGVLVSRDDHRLPPGGGVLLGDGADEVVGLPAVHLVHGNVHGGKDIFQQGHLAGQLLGHPLSGGLVPLVGQMAEGGSLAVKGDAQGVGLPLIQQFIENVQKAKNGVGGLSRPGGEILAHPVKGPVDNGVAVQDHELFHLGSP